MCFDSKLWGNCNSLVHKWQSLKSVFKLRFEGLKLDNRKIIVLGLFRIGEFIGDFLLAKNLKDQFISVLDPSGVLSCIRLLIF